MQFEKDHIYHLFNQGNNRRNIFFNKENYLFFLLKIKTYIIPYSDILAWCLMPNHFHLMLMLKNEELVISQGSQGFTSSEALTKTRTFNDSLGIMLRSYTRAINKQEEWSGSLFRKETKVECVNRIDGITPSFISRNGITEINISDPEKEYPKICFNYIHQNPVKVNIVKTNVDWEFSSAPDYYGKRNGKLVNKILAKELGLIS